jgi:hypothetical protein
MLLGVFGCGPPVEETVEDGLRVVRASLKSGAQGQVKFTLPVDDAETALLATLQVPEPFLTHFECLDAPKNNPLFDWDQETGGLYSKTNAGFVAQAVTLNWPILASDAALESGRYRFCASVVEGNQFVKQDVELTIALKRDPDFSSGSLQVAIVYAGGVDEDPELVAATEAALDLWVDLYADVGIEVLFSFYTFPNGSLDPPAFGTEDDFIAIAEMTSFREVNVVIAPEIAGLEDVFGISGDIPGPLVSSRRSGVLVSALLSAGADGAFTAEEVRIFAETMAHETGHYLGLFHPVEATFDSWDVLMDTPVCTSELDCVMAMEDHLMFPFPVCGIQSCTPQGVITDEQAAVLNRHAAID